MNAERLLAYYEKVADAPDAVERLRQFILSLAVRGKLVPQLAKERRASNFDTELPIDIETPFDIPKNWRWSRLRKLGKLVGGGTPSKSRDDFWNGNIPWVSPKDMKADYINKSLMNISSDAMASSAANLIGIGSLLFVVRGMILAHSFPVAISGVSLTINQDMKALCLKEPEIGEFLLRVLKGLKPEMLRRVQRSSHGTCRLDSADYGDFLLPLPPLAEQHRIIAKVDELMGLCDRLEAARADRETARDRLAAASLARLNTPETAAAASPPPETSHAFADHARFGLDALPALTARPDQIKILRQTILNLAVHGKLVPQDTADEPALDHLLGLAEVPAKARKQLKPLNLAECSGSLPHSWVWLPLGSIIRSMDAGWSPQCENHPRSNEGEWGVLKTTAVQALAFQPNQHKLLSKKMQPRPHIQAEIGDILITRAGPKNRVGVSCVVDVPCPRLMISDKLIRFHPFGDLLPRYIALTLNAGFTLSQVDAAKSGMAIMQMNISQDKLRAIAIPLPPVAEQHRIVAKVDALMTLCDKLEASLTAAADTRRRLLDALLAEALAPYEDRLLEAAE